MLSIWSLPRRWSTLLVLAKREKQRLRYALKRISCCVDEKLDT